MNKRGHVMNAVLLSAGIALLLEGKLLAPTVRTFVAVAVPVTLGALFPDIDTTFGRHRKTFHNLATLGLFVGFPILFGNLRFVWIGVLAHYVLDLTNTRGLALFYPWPREYDVPFGVPVSSKWATTVTLSVTVVEIGVVAAVLYTETHEQVLNVAASLGI